MEIFSGFFSNLFNIVIGVIFMLVGVIIGIILYRVITRPQNQVNYCRERDGRGMELNFKKEDAVSLETNTSPPLRFFKYGRSYEFRKRGKSYTRFFGKEGTAYTWILEGYLKVKGKMKEIQLKFPTLSDAVKSIWGEEFFSTVPEDRRKALENNALLVTVNLEPGITPEGYQPITESTIRKKNREDAKDLIARGLKGAVSKDWFERLAWIGAGVGICMMGMLLLGVIG